MKIGIDIRVIGKNRTGDEAYFFNLVKNLAAIDKENEYHLYIDRDPKEDDKLSSRIKELELGYNFRIEIMPAGKFWWNFYVLSAHLRKSPVDVFHTQYITPFWMPKNIKLITTIHDISFNFFPQYIKKSDLFFLKAFIPRSVKKANKVIAVSKFSREEIINFYKISPDKTTSVYNGVDYEKFNREFSEEKKEEVRKKYDLPEKFILYVGTLQPRKNIPALIEAFSALQKKYSMENVKLVVAGSRSAHNTDPGISKLIDKCNLESEIIFPGWIEEKDLPVIYKLAWCFAFPSLYEGFGIPIIEAMAAGIPVVSSNKASLQEVGGDGALFVNPEDKDKFAESLYRVITDDKLRLELIKKGEAVARKFSWRETAERTLKVYKSVVSKT